MQNRSELYNRMMRSDTRDITTASIYIGAVNQEAQGGSSVIGSFWKYADISTPLEMDASVEKRYITWEENMNKLDGSMYFLPETSDETIYNNGIVSDAVCTEEIKPVIEVRFNTPSLDIKGLTIEFAESYPQSFVIETNTGNYFYEAEGSLFVTEDVYEKIDYIRIIPDHMSHGITRLRIEKLMFGIGIGLTGNKITSMTIKEKTHPISLELPTIDFSFTVDNLDRYFNANADDSVINFLERGQKVKAYFTQTLEDKSTETIKAADAVLDATWKDKGSTAEFSATDILYQMDGIYEDGIYRKEGITAYDLAVDVFEHAGVDSKDYFLDPYLQDIILHNPLPKDTYANCILLIANACRCVMKQDRDGRVMLKASFIPELITKSENEAPYSSTELLLEAAEAVNYFEWQKKYNRLDGSMFFKPEDEKYLYAGYASYEISDVEGCFAKNPIVILEASAAFTFYQLTLQFGNVYPRKARIHCFNNGNEQENFEIKITGVRHIINYTFENVDMLQIEFVEAAAYNRIHLRGIFVGDTTDFTIYRNDMFAEPVTERQDRIKNLIAIRTVYSKPNDQADVFSDTLTISSENAFVKMEFNDASIPVSVITTISSEDEEDIEDIIVDYGAEIIRYSSWYCEVRFLNPPEENVQVNVTVKGYIYNISNPQYVLNVNTTGSTPDALKNPLLDSVELAEKYAIWCAEYYKAKAEYTMSKIIADPILESNDLVFFEDEDESVRLIRIHTINLKFDGTYNGSSCMGRSV